MSVNVTVNAVLSLAGAQLGVELANDKAVHSFKFSAYPQFPPKKCNSFGVPEG